MRRRTLYGIIGGLIFLFVGVFIGFLLGTYIGGNYYPEFALGNWQGYEAAGWIGLVIGGIIGAIFGYNLAVRIANRWGF